MHKLAKGILIFLLSAVIFLSAVFLLGRFGWKLGGFRACESAGIEQVEVSDGQVRIRGFCPGSFPRGFLGYHAEQVDSTLYVGFHFSGLFGIFETGDFDITIPVQGTVTQIVVKGNDGEAAIWSGAAMPDQTEAPAVDTDVTENGIYVLLERDDVYSVGWYYENNSGGMINAAETPLESGQLTHLLMDIYQTAANLERPVPVMLVFSDRENAAIAQVNLRYDPQDPVLIVRMDANGTIYVNGVVAEEATVPETYVQILSQYRTAVEENWGRQQLVDAGLNYLIQDMSAEELGYAVEDLDGNGSPELIIGANSTNGFCEKMVFVLYSLDSSGTPVQIFSTGERDRYYYAGGIRFANVGSSGADSSFETTLKLEGLELVDMTFTTDPADYVQMPLIPIMGTD